MRVSAVCVALAIAAIIVGQVLEGGHQIKCHLSREILVKMEPVIKIAAE